MIKKIPLLIIILILLSACQKQVKNTPVKTLDSNDSQPNNIALEKHNQLRQLHFSDANLIYSLKLEADAQSYANELADSGQFIHDTDNLVHKYGENLYRFSGTEKPNLAKIIQKWYDEKKYYDQNKGTCEIGRMCGHYTQIVWKNSKLLGCASAQYLQGSFKDGYVTVCKYYPYGNIVGKDPY